MRATAPVLSIPDRADCCNTPSVVLEVSLYISWGSLLQSVSGTHRTRLGSVLVPLPGDRMVLLALGKVMSRFVVMGLASSANNGSHSVFFCGCPDHCHGTSDGDIAYPMAP